LIWIEFLWVWLFLGRLRTSQSNQMMSQL
jgi:hypothetical protein